jgi:NADH dehydrogenase
MIFVTGAAGFVGRNLAARLLDKGIKVRGLILAGETPPIEHPGLEWREGDVCEKSSLESCFEGVSAVVHLAAVVANPDESVNRAVNVEGTRNLLDLAKAKGVGRFLFMSAAAAKFKSKNAYGKSKREAEKAVAASGLDYANLRIPLIIGRGGEEFDRFVDYVGKFPLFVPVFGDGTAQKRPIFIDDVVTAVERLLEGPALGGRTYEIACREKVTLDQLIDETLKAHGQRKAKLHVPLGLSLVLAGIVETILGSRSPITRDIVLGLNEDVEFDVEESLERLGLNPLTVEESLFRATSDRNSNRNETE